MVVGLVKWSWDYAGVNSRYMYIAVTLLPLHSRYRYSVVKHFTVI